MAAFLEKLHHRRRGVHILTEPSVADDTLGDRLQILENPVGVGHIAFFALRWSPGDPDAAARQRGGSAEVRRLLDDERVESGRIGGERGGHAAATGADDEDVDRLVELVGRHGAGTAVRTANPAINSGAAR